MENEEKNMLEDTNYSERTQISLSPILRRVIDTKRRLWGESLSEYIRKSVMLRVLAEGEEEKERARAAEVFVGAVDSKRHPEWATLQKVVTWQKNLRKEPKQQ